MQSIYELIQVSYPRDPHLEVVGITVPLVGIACKTTGVVDPVNDIKEAAAAIYNEAVKIFLKPLWDFLNKILSALEAIVGKILDIDLTIPILGIKVSDLWGPDLRPKIEAKVTEFYENNKPKLIELLKTLGIPYPIMIEVHDPIYEIKEIAKRILLSLWSYVFKIINQIIDAILLAWGLYVKIKEALYASTQNTAFLDWLPGIPWDKLWENVVMAVIKKIVSALLSMPTLQEIEDFIMAYARRVLKKFDVTYEEVMRVIRDIEIPPFGKPFDVILPLNPSVNKPNLDFNRLLDIIKNYMNNFLAALIEKFCQAVLQLFDVIFKILGIAFDAISNFRVPVVLCAIRI